MQRYVTSMKKNARLVHLGSRHSTLCGCLLMSAVEVADLPSDRAICLKCVGVATAYGRITYDEALALAAHQPTAGHEAIPLALLAALKAGLDNAGIARSLNIGLRTAVRYLNEAMHDAGAKTRWQWGYTVGLAEGRTVNSG